MSKHLPKHLRPWSIVDDEEIRLLRRLRELVTQQVPNTPPAVEAVLDMLGKL